MWEMRNSYNPLAGNIDIEDLEEIRWKDVDWTRLVQEGMQ
jgi:hypothetical protein